MKFGSDEQDGWDSFHAGKPYEPPRGPNHRSEEWGSGWLRASRDRRADPQPTIQGGKYDPTKSIGERLYDAAPQAGEIGWKPWQSLSGLTQSEYERTALNFVARLSS